MIMTNKEQIIDYFEKNKLKLRADYGVRRIGIFGSLITGNFNENSDIDIAIDMEKEKKNIHNFFELKRTLEKELNRKIDLGFIDSIKPIIKENIEKHIIYI